LNDSIAKDERKFMTNRGEKTIIVLSMSMSMAHIVRPLEVAKVLREMDYRVVFTGDGKATKIAQQAGFELRSLPEWDLPSVIAKLQAGADDLHPIKQVEEWVRAELELYETEQPVVVLDDSRVTSSISSKAAGLPRISLQNAYQNPYAINGAMEFKYEGPRGLFVAGDELPYIKIWEKYGLPKKENILEMFEADLILLSDVPEFAPMHTVPDHYKYVGPIIWGSDLENPPWLDKLDPEKPIIYFTMGSTGPQGAFQSAIEIFGKTEYQLMMTLGSLVKLNGLQSMPSGIFVANFASGDVLAGKADLMICHGGNGTVYQALRAGIPIVSLPTVKDQHWNANRLSELGVGITISSTAELLNAAEEVLKNPSYREAALSFSKILMDYDGPQTAAHLIHEYIEALEIS